MNVVHCMNGNLLAAKIRLGWLEDPQVQRALECQAHAITGEAPIKFTRYGTSGPQFTCQINEHQQCEWGATKEMKALQAVLVERRSPIVRRILERGAQFLLRYDLAKAAYPYTGRVSTN